MLIASRSELGSSAANRGKTDRENKGSQVWITTGKVSPRIPFGQYAERPIVRNKGSQVYNGEGVTPLVSFGYG